MGHILTLTIKAKFSVHWSIFLLSLWTPIQPCLPMCYFPNPSVSARKKRLIFPYFFIFFQREHTRNQKPHRHLCLIKANEKLYQMQVNPFRFCKLITLGITLNSCISGNFGEKLENHGEIPHLNINICIHNITLWTPQIPPASG